MNDFDLFKILNGGLTQNIRIGNIEKSLAREIGAHTTTVWLTPATAQKQRYKHDDVILYHYGLIGNAFQDGWAINDRPRHILFVYEDKTVYPGFWKAVVKANKAGDELFLSTFHKLETRRFRANRRKNNRILRHHRKKKSGRR